MARIIAPPRFLLRPGITPRLRRNHPLTAGMTSYWCPSIYPSFVVDLAKPRPTSGQGGRTVGAMGLGISNSTIWSVGAASDTSDLDWTSGPFTVAGWAEFPAINTTDYVELVHRFNYVDETNNQGWLVRLNASTDAFPGINFEIFKNNSTTNYNFSSSVSHLAGLQFWCGRSDGSTTKAIFVGGPAYGNGRLTKTTSTTGNLVPDSGTSNPFGSRIDGAGGTSSTLYVAATWKRLLNDGEVEWFYQEPYGVLEAPALAAEIAVSVRFRKTLSPLGTHAGGRQAQAA